MMGTLTGEIVKCQGLPMEGPWGFTLTCSLTLLLYWITSCLSELLPLGQEVQTGNGFKKRKVSNIPYAKKKTPESHL